MKKVFKNLNMLSLILIILTSIFCLSACVSGVVSEKQYTEIFSGVDALDEDGNSVFYQMKTLVDNTQFNTSIQSKPYRKLDIYIDQSCQIKAVIFIVRSSKNCTLKFTTYIDEEIVSSKTKNLPDCLVIVTENKVTVTVDEENLKQDTVAKICNVIMEETGRSADKIVIQSKY